MVDQVGVGLQRQYERIPSLYRTPLTFEPKKGAFLMTRNRTLSQPPAGSTGLVRTVHALRKRPIGELSAYELSRMIGQEVGLPWLMPVALEILSETAPAQAGGGFYDEELLSAVLTCSSEVWRTSPQWVEEVSGILHQLVDLSPYIQSDVKEFLDNTRNI